MKTALVQPAFMSAKLKENQTSAKNDVSFGARYFTQQQLQECKQVIRGSSISATSIRIVSCLAMIFTAGATLVGLIIASKGVGVSMVNELSKILKLSDNDVAKTNVKVPWFFFDAEETGDEFIHKASKLD